MKTVLSVVLVVCVACGGKKSDNANEKATAKPTDTTTCPMPVARDVKERFAVGSVPSYRVNSMAEAPKCHDVFVASDVVKIESDKATLVAEGTFKGHCPGEEKYPDLFEAVKPDKAVIEVSGTHTSLGGEIGLGKPVLLDSKLPDKLVSVTARVVDRCGTPLGGHGEAAWSVAPECEKVAKLVPWDLLTGKPEPTSPQMQIAAVGPGTCTVSVTMFGAKGDVSVTVK